MFRSVVSKITCVPIFTNLKLIIETSLVELLISIEKNVLTAIMCSE